MNKTLMAAVLAGGLVLLAGCQEAKEKPISVDEVRSWMVDDLSTPYETEAEVANRATHTVIINGRKINADLMRMFLLDRPSRDVSAPTIGTYN